MVEPPPTSMELCIAEEAQQHLCLDPCCREHWRPDCDLCFPSMLRPPSQAQHDRDCSNPAVVATCTALIARWPEIWNNSAYKRSRVPPAVRLEATCGALVLAIALLFVVRLSRRRGV